MKCPLCGTKYKGNFCPGCGARTSYNDNSNIDEQKKMIIGISAIIVTLLISLLFAGVVFFFIISSVRNDSSTLFPSSEHITTLPHDYSEDPDHNDYFDFDTPDSDYAHKLAGDMESFSYTYTSGADTRYETSVEPLSTGKYVITKNSEHLMSPVEIQITGGDYKKITDLFDAYNVLSTDSMPVNADEEYSLHLTAYSVDGDMAEYVFETQNYEYPEITEFLDELEYLYESFGEWNYTEDLYDVPSIVDFSLIVQDGNTTDHFNLANDLEDYSISESVLESEEVKIDMNHIQYREYENGKSGTYYLAGLSNADMMELESIIAKHNIWDQKSSGTGEYISGGNVPDDQHFFAILVQKDGEEPLLLTYSKNVPSECLDFFDEIVETYLP